MLWPQLSVVACVILKRLDEGGSLVVGVLHVSRESGEACVEEGQHVAEVR